MSKPKPLSVADKVKADRLSRFYLHEIGAAVTISRFQLFGGGPNPIRKRAVSNLLRQGLIGRVPPLTSKHVVYRLSASEREHLAGK